MDTAAKAPCGVGGSVVPWKKTKRLLQMQEADFPGGAVVKNLPINAGDRGSSSGPGDPMCHRATKPVRHNY